MYRRPKFLEALLEIRREMALEADYDVELFVENARRGQSFADGKFLAEIQAASEPIDLDPKVSPAGRQRRKFEKR